MVWQARRILKNKTQNRRGVFGGRIVRGGRQTREDNGSVCENDQSILYSCLKYHNETHYCTYANIFVTC